VLLRTQQRVPLSRFFSVLCDSLHRHLTSSFSSVAVASAPQRKEAVFVLNDGSDAMSSAPKGLAITTFPVAENWRELLDGR
jgi:hypothetical protein